MLAQEPAAVHPAPRRRRGELRRRAQHEPGLNAVCGDKGDNLRTRQRHTLDILRARVDCVDIVRVEKPRHERVVRVVSDVHVVTVCTSRTSLHDLRIDT